MKFMILEVTMQKKSKVKQSGLQICRKCPLWTYCIAPEKAHQESSKIHCLNEAEGE